MRYVLVPGADGRALYWQRVAPLLKELGHDAIAVDLPVGDPRAGLDEHADAVIAAIEAGAGDTTIVAQSLGGFIAPLAAARRPVAQVTLLNPMIPKPGETVGEWWAATGFERARREHYARVGLDFPEEFDMIDAFFHDVPPDVVEQLMAARSNPQAFDRLWDQPWPLTAWPNVPTRVLQGRDDRFFPAEFQGRIVGERLGIGIDLIPGGHCAALSRPKELVRTLTSHGSRGHAEVT